jgi:hypothetical protein
LKCRDVGVGRGELEVMQCCYTVNMANTPHPGRRGNPVSLAPLTPDAALRAALQVKLSDVRKLEAAEVTGKKKGKGKK